MKIEKLKEKAEKILVYYEIKNPSFILENSLRTAVKQIIMLALMEGNKEGYLEGLKDLKGKLINH